MQDGSRQTPNPRTGKHFCVKCLAETPDEQFFRNDHICDRCADSDEYPLKSTPDDANETKKGA